MIETLQGLTRDIADRLSKRPFCDPQKEARLIIEQVMGLPFPDQLLASRDAVKPEHRNAIEAIVQRRESGEPLARITSRASFRDFDVDLVPDALVPRDDTSVLVDAALGRIAPDSESRIADLGTGSGIILIALARERTSLRGTGFDISAAAIESAKNNACRLGVADRLSFVQSDWLTDTADMFDGIVSNPPYISDVDYAALPEEVQNHDPAQALRGGTDGLDHYRQILRQAPDRLTERGWVIVEIGATQAADVKQLGLKAGFEFINVHKDLAGRDRALEFEKSD